MRGDIIARVLGEVVEIGRDASDLFGVFLSIGYGASLNKFQYELSKKKRDRSGGASEAQMKQRYYSLLYKLERQGFIERKKKSNSVLIRITHAGKEKLNVLKKQKKENIPAKEYAEESGDKKFIIVAFDIPEHSKRKRVWLRAALRGLGMHMIQKSVWAGKIKLPKMFLLDLRNYTLLEYVEIFEISKAGSLRQID